MKKTTSLILTVILLIVFAVFALGSGDSEETTVTKNSKTQETASSENKRDEIRVGETLNIGDFKITYDSVEKWNSNNQFIQPGNGNQFIRLHFSVANDTDSDRYIGTFECYADGVKCAEHYTGDNILSFDSISSGRKTSGYVYFEVPVNATEIEVEYETSIMTDKKAYFIVQL